MVFIRFLLFFCGQGGWVNGVFFPIKLPNSQWDVLQAETCGFPPLEDREKSVTFCAGLDFFGGGTFTKEETVSFLWINMV